MKFKIGKYIYLINDITSMLLKKERVNDREDTKKLRIALIIISIILIFSIVLNFYFYFICLK